MRKNQKYIYFGIGVFLILAGQFFLLSKQNYTACVAFTAVSLAFFALGFTNADLIGLAEKIAAFFRTLSENAAKMAAQAGQAPVPVIPAGKRGKSASKKGAPQVLAQPDKPNPGAGIMLFFKAIIENAAGRLKKTGAEGSPGSYLSFDLVVPKMAVLIISILVLVCSQYFLFTQKFSMFFAFVAVSVMMFVYFIRLKEPNIKFTVTLEKGVKILLLICGTACLLIGWFLLLKNNIALQEFGTAVTVVGIILTFLGLPENADKRDAAHLDLKEEILLADHKFANNYIFKAVMLILMVIFVVIGNKLLPSQETNLTAIYFYMAAIGCLFFALPLLSYRERPLIDNIYTRIISLVVIIAAFFIALKGQVLFTQHNINEAVKLFFIAGFMFVFAAPVYDAKKLEDKLPIKLEMVFLAVIIMVALWLRLYDLDLRPFGIENDEAGGFIFQFLGKLKGSSDYNVGNYGLGFNITSFFSWLLGGRTDRTVMKLVGVSLGVISVPIMYFFIRAAINARTAMFVTVIFTFLRWSVHYGRTSHFGFFTILGMLAAVYFIILALRRRDKLSFLMAGLSFGLTWHGVMTGFLVVVPIGIYFLFKSINEKRFFRKNFIGIVAFCLGFWVFTSIMVHNYFISSKIYFSRASEVSVFGGDPNAPRNVGKGILDNAKIVLLMFNHMGDSRQRNSGGMPNEPTVDFSTAIFFGIGLIYCMYYSRNYLFFIMVMLFFSQAAGSIFSIEAPSAMRAMGTMGPMLYFAGITFDIIWQSIKRVFGEKTAGTFIFPVLLVAMLWNPVKDNYNEYFGRWIGGMDELSTAAGKYSAELGEKYRILLFTSTYYPGHPPYKFYRHDYKVSNTDCPEDGFQPITLITDENYAIFHHYDTWQMLSYWERKFPDSKIVEVDHHYFNKKLKPGEGMGKFFTAQLISNADIQKIRGLYATYVYAGGATEKVTNDDAAFNPDRAQKAPYKVSWSGQVYFMQYGDTAFTKQGGANVTLYIDGKKIEWGRNYQVLKGLNKIRIEAYRKDAADTFKISYVTKHLGMSGVFKEDTLTKLMYYQDFMPEGLHAYFYGGTAWETDSLQWEEFEPYVYFNMASYIGNYTSLKWGGSLDIPADGSYYITAPSGAYSKLVIDGKWYMAVGSPPPDANVAAFLSKQKAMPVQSFNLKRGRHKLEIYATKTSDIRIVWRRGMNVAEEILPPELLTPDPDMQESKTEINQSYGAAAAGKK